MSLWEAIPLGKAGTWLSGGTPSKQQPELWSGPVPWVSPKDMKQSRLQDAIDHVSLDAIENGTQLAPQASLLMVVRGMILAHTFPVALALRPLAFNQDIKALVPSDRFKSEFLLYWLQAKSPEVLRLVDVANHGTKRLPSERLFALKVLAPPAWEQDKIAAILSSVDDAIQTTQAVIDQLVVVKKALMAELLTRGIPGRHTKFKQTEIGEVPEEWSVVPLEVLADQGRSTLVNGPFGSDLLTSELVSMGVPVVYIRDIRDGRYLRRSEAYVTDEKAMQLAFCRVCADDLLVAKVGDPPGTAAIYPAGEPPGIVTQDVIRLRTDSRRAVPAFVWAYLNSSLGIAQIDTISIEGTRKRFSLTDFRRLPVPVPHLDEQVKIADNLLAVEDRISSETGYLSGLCKQRSALMSALLTGDLRVPPAETPA